MTIEPDGTRADLRNYPGPQFPTGNAQTGRPSPARGKERSLAVQDGQPALWNKLRGA